MTIILSKSSRLFLEVIEGKVAVLSRFNPHRSKVADKKPTVAEKIAAAQ